MRSELADLLESWVAEEKAKDERLVKLEKVAQAAKKLHDDYYDDLVALGNALKDLDGDG